MLRINRINRIPKKKILYNQARLNGLAIIKDNPILLVLNNNMKFTGTQKNTNNICYKKMKIESYFKIKKIQRSHMLKHFQKLKKFQILIYKVNSNYSL